MGLLCPHGYKDEYRVGLPRNIYLIKFKTFQAIGNPVNTTKQGLDAGWLGFYLNDPLCTMAIKQTKRKNGVCGWVLEENVFPCGGGMSSINRP